MSRGARSRASSPGWPGAASAGRFAVVRRSLVALFTFAQLAGCGEPDREPTWDELDRDARLEYMTSVVLPTMRDIFQARDPERYAGFSCHSCHGVDFAAVDYAMPNALTPLPKDDTLAAAEAIDAGMTAFMLDEVFPVMAELLGRDKYNHDTAPDGFRCVGCHRVAD